MSVNDLAYANPSDAVWWLVRLLEPYIWWVIGLSAGIISVGFALMPIPRLRSVSAPTGVHPLAWTLAMWSRTGVIVSGILIAMSVLTPINAFGPLGALSFFPSLAVNVACLIWCNRQRVLSELKATRSPEMILIRSFIAGRRSDP